MAILYQFKNISLVVFALFKKTILSLYCMFVNHIEMCAKGDSYNK